MNIPALKAKIGTWDYYVTVLTFEQVDKYVSKIDDQLHKSESLKDLIQRSITDNYKSLKEYIIKQPELFFNSLVLAVYDDFPSWREIEFKYSNVESYSMGLLEFPGNHKIFPVDGQHRVEGIKAALIENPKLANEKIAAIFIGHKNDDSGKKRTRRLFSTLNRYAKPVTPDDIIALDEDDSAAIMTRELLEEYDLFTGKRVVYAKQKAIPFNNNDAITSIITLYQANIELFKAHYFEVHNKKLTKKGLEEQLKFRPSEKEFNSYRKFSYKFWDGFKGLDFIKSFMSQKDHFAKPFRNNEKGGNLIFRPVGFLPFVKAAILIKFRKGDSFKEIFKELQKLDFEINNKPWQYVVWTPVEKKMIMNSASLTELLIIFLFDKKLITEAELKKLKAGYASKLSFDNPKKVTSILNELTQ